MNVFRALAACAVCLMSLAHPAPLAAQAPGEPAEGNVSIYNLESQSRTAGIAIDGSIDKAVASRALELIRFLRPDHDEVTVYLNSPGGTHPPRSRSARRSSGCRSSPPWTSTRSAWARAS